MLPPSQPPKQTAPEQSPLLTLHAQYAAYLKNKNRGSRREHTAPKAKRIIQSCGFASYADIDATRVLDFVSSLRGPRFGDVTVNKYLKEMRAFCKWCCRFKNESINPLSSIDLVKVRIKKRPRRAFSHAEIDALLESTLSKPKPFRGMKPADRHLLYRVALNTGYRANELSLLTPTCLVLDAGAHWLRLATDATKNLRGGNQPLVIAA
jgi:integrase